MIRISVAGSFAAASLAAVVLFSTPAQAQATKKPKVGTSGTAQMAGGDGRFGTVYTLTDNNGGLLNVNLVSAAYSVTRHDIAPGETLVPKAGDKLLILHLRIKNPKPGDQYVSGTTLTFASVASDGQTRQHGDDMRLETAKAPLQDMLKPGQAEPADVLMGCIVPAQGPVPKLIVNWGRNGTSDKVFRYALGKAPNLVKPLAAGEADPSDPTGATAYTNVPAKLDVIYPLGIYNFQISSIAYVPGPIGATSAGDGKRFLVVTAVVTNKTWRAVYTNGFVSAALTTADDEKTTDFTLLKGKRDEPYDGRSLDPDETMTVRLAFVVPNDTTGTKLSLAEVEDNSNTLSRALVFDVSGVK
jgi:hypothetical protein